MHEENYKKAETMAAKKAAKTVAEVKATAAAEEG